MRTSLIYLIVLAVGFTLSSPAAAFEAVDDRPSRHLQVEVWLNKHNGSVYEPGQHVRVYFQTSEDCYAAVYNVDTEGFVNVLYPKYNDRAWVEAGRIYEIPDPYDDYDLVVDGPKGIEYVVAVCSAFPLNLQAIYDIEDGLDNDVYWPLGRITGDPHVAIHEINETLAWGDEEYEPEGYASDVSWFYVRQWVPYPRYIVYHWYPEYIYDPWWDPYVHAHIWIDFYWDHYWCRPWWWCRGCQPIYVYWYIDRDTGRRVTWKGHYHQDRRKPDWYRDKPVRRGGGGERPSRYDDNNPTTWEDRRRSPWGDQGTDADAIRERAQGRESMELERQIQKRSQQEDQERKRSDDVSRRTSSRLKENQRTSRPFDRGIRDSEPESKSRSQENIRSRSSGTSETKKITRSSSRRSTIEKIIGGVGKIFSGDSKKERNTSSRQSQSSSSKSKSSSNSSSNRSSKSSSESEKKSR